MGPVYDPRRVLANLESLPVGLLDRLRARRRVREPLHNWRYDPIWCYFVCNTGRIQEIVPRESAEGAPAWAHELGLGVTARARLVAHPTEGAYRSARGATEPTPS